jgi:hypothetical protein
MLYPPANLQCGTNSKKRKPRKANIQKTYFLLTPTEVLLFGY